jgi:hypothetical protein
VLPLVCLCVGLLWLWPRRVAAGVVAAALTAGLAVLLAPALAIRLG